jgi:hypothetical protein
MEHGESEQWEGWWRRHPTLATHLQCLKCAVSDVGAIPDQGNRHVGGTTSFFLSAKQEHSS